MICVHFEFNSFILAAEPEANVAKLSVIREGYSSNDCPQEFVSQVDE